ncbi:MAG: carbon storage regulator CsrA [Spirochaetes bacterium]|uniref:Translational regulator CsrA n=1 Tax=Candidatus Gallitreponema excrementavium TaxID=2840840 RepID=A0A9D9HN35_9SPIR|nr:carbon storage regulator CsrA [Candidatus Gallitreponema excrementavium]
MLILSRKTNEKIVIGDSITISIIEVRGDQVKIGVDAPRSVKVFRQEVFEAIQNENKAAVVAVPESLDGLSGLGDLIKNRN